MNLYIYHMKNIYIIALSIVDQLTLSRLKESFAFLSAAIEIANLNFVKVLFEKG